MMSADREAQALTEGAKSGRLKKDGTPWGVRKPKTLSEVLGAPSLTEGLPTCEMYPSVFEKPPTPKPAKTAPKVEAPNEAPPEEAYETFRFVLIGGVTREVSFPKPITIPKLLNHIRARSNDGVYPIADGAIFLGQVLYLEGIA